MLRWQESVGQHLSNLDRPAARIIRGDAGQSAGQRLEQFLVRAVFRRWREAIGRERSAAGVSQRVQVIDADLRLENDVDRRVELKAASTARAYLDTQSRRLGVIRETLDDKAGLGVPPHDRRGRGGLCPRAPDRREPRPADLGVDATRGRRLT